VNDFGDRLNRLFERARARGQPLTNEDIERLTNGRIRANHVWLSLIALFFQVADHAAFPPSLVQIDIATGGIRRHVRIPRKV